MGTGRDQVLAERIPQGVSVHDVEEALRAVAGVEACRLVTDKSMEIIELHALADTARSPKQIVRDIQATLVTRFGIRIDYRKIGVAQLRDEGVEKELLSRHRLKIKRISLATQDRSASCSVTLSLGERTYEGRAEGPDSRSSSLRLASMAALRAVEEVLRGATRFVLEEIRELGVAGKDVIIVSLIAYDKSGDVQLVGAAVAEDNALETSAKATMNAINRYLASLEEGQRDRGPLRDE